MTRSFRIVLALVALMFTLPAPAAGLSAADQKTLSGYTLSSGFLDRCKAVVADARARHVEVGGNFLGGGAGGLDGMAARIDAKPGVHEILAAHALSAREYLIGSIALMRAAMAVQMSADPAQAQYVDQSKTSAANLAFYRAHRAEIDALMHADDGDD